MVVLYVDPNAEVRAARAACLEEQGFLVHQADDAATAVGVAQDLPALDVLVCEGVLGEYTGFDLRDAIVEKFPELRTIFTSRYDLTGFEEAINGCPLVYDPVPVSRLITEVRGTLQAVPPVEEAPPAVEVEASVAALTPSTEETDPPSAPAPTPAPSADAPVAVPEPVAPTSAKEVATAPVKSGPPKPVKPPAAATRQTSAPVRAVPVSGSETGLLQATLVTSDEDEEYKKPPILAPETVLGNYVIKERLYAEADSESYIAVQKGVSREVVMVLLKPEKVANPTAVADFQERQRVKAAISHPRIAPLYESLQIGKYHFYTRELPHGMNVEKLHESGEKFSEKILADIIGHIAEAMSHATHRGYHYRMLSGRDVFIDSEHQASIVNVFRPAGSRTRDFVADTKKLLYMLRTIADGPRARHLIDDLIKENLDWEALRQRALEFQEEFRERSLLKRADTKEAQVIESARHSARIPVWAYAAILLLLVGAGAVLVQRGIGRPKPAAPVQQTMKLVPEGKFLFRRGETKELPAYWMDTHEVTIGQYAEFLEALAADPTKATAYDHPDQPKTKKNHRPERWDAYLAAARTGGFFNNQPMDINCPVVNVDWWDAFAYAKWRGHRLPSEEEWEKAARGTDGRTFPWGNDARVTAANLGTDYDPKGKGGSEDGYNFWAPVNKLTEDVSPEGVVGMAGNVEEWTATWSNHPDYPDLLVPVVRGGHFAQKSPANVLSSRTYAQTPSEATLARGFRTVSDNEPEPQAESKS